jgi:signal transduction histidine kinase
VLAQCRSDPGAQNCRVERLRQVVVSTGDLGLALVKYILDRHDGRLTVESVPGQEAAFTAHLPLAGDGVGEAPPLTATR